MVIETLQFGAIEIAEDRIISFENGIPGFEEIKRFALIDVEESYPVLWLQAIDQPHISLATINPFLLFEDYDIEICDDEISELCIKDQEDVMVLCVLVVPKNVYEMTVNLVAPIVINVKNSKAKQLLIDSKKFLMRQPAYSAFCKVVEGGISDAGSEQKG